jgi:seryl-tRNA synthetase
MINQTETQQKVIQSMTAMFQSRFELEKLSNKLENWHELEFKDFLKELNKAKVQLSLAQEAEWMQYFNEQKQKAQALKTQINQTDKEIDQMVYKLYELTDEEIRVVEGE